MNRNLWSTNDYDPVLLEFLNYLENRLPRLSFRFRAGAHHLPGAEDQGCGLRFLQPVDQTGKLFWPVLDPWKDPDYGVEVYFLIEGRRSDNVLDVDEGLAIV